VLLVLVVLADHGKMDSTKTNSIGVNLAVCNS